MPHETVSLRGTVQDLFAHRFSLKTSDGLVLADLTPPGHDQIKLVAGDVVEIEGERKPSEIKVQTLKRGDETITIAKKEKHPHHHG